MRKQNFSSTCRGDLANEQQMKGKACVFTSITQGDRMLTLSYSGQKRYSFSPVVATFVGITPPFKYLGMHTCERLNTYTSVLCTGDRNTSLWRFSSSQALTTSQSLLYLYKDKKILTVRKFLLEWSNKFFSSDFNLLLLICKKGH